MGREGGGGGGNDVHTCARKDMGCDEGMPAKVLVRACVVLLVFMFIATGLV